MPTSKSKKDSSKKSPAYLDSFFGKKVICATVKEGTCDWGDPAYNIVKNPSMSQILTEGGNLKKTTLIGRIYGYDDEEGQKIFGSTANIQLVKELVDEEMHLQDVADAIVADFADAEVEGKARDISEKKVQEIEDAESNSFTWASLEEDDFFVLLSDDENEDIKDAFFSEKQDFPSGNDYVTVKGKSYLRGSNYSKIFLGKSAGTTEEISSAEKASQKVQEGKKMPTEKKSGSFFDTLKEEAEEAAYRAAAEKISEGIRNILQLALMSQMGENATLAGVSAFLDSKMGSSLVQTLAGHAINFAPTKLSEDPRLKRLGKEFRVSGMATGMSSFASALMDGFAPILEQALALLPGEEKKTRVGGSSGIGESAVKSISDLISSSEESEENSTAPSAARR